MDFACHLNTKMSSPDYRFDATKVINGKLAGPACGKEKAGVLNARSSEKQRVEFPLSKNIKRSPMEKAENASRKTLMELVRN